MANFPITPTDVRLESGKTQSRNMEAATTGVAGELVREDLDAQGAPVLKLANATTDADSAVAGMLLNNASPGQPATYALPGSVITVNDQGAANVAATAVLSRNGGKFAPNADLLTGDWVTTVGAFRTTTQFVFSVNRVRAQKP